MGFWSKSSAGAASTASAISASFDDEMKYETPSRHLSSNSSTRKEQILRKRNWKRVEKKARREIDKFPYFSKERRLSIGELKELKQRVKRQGSMDSDDVASIQQQEQQQPEEELKEFTNLMKEFHVGAKEFRHNQKRAKRGEPDAQYELGCCYHYGTFVDEDESAAVQWWVKAANQDHLEAQLKLAWWYHHGTRPRPEQHLYWLQRAAQSGDVKAQRTMALYYYNRQEQWQQQPSDDGTSSEEMMERNIVDDDANDYYGGDYPNKNPDEIVLMPTVELEPNMEMHAHWLEQAALQGNAEAQYILGLCYHPMSSPLTSLHEDQQEDHDVPGLLRYDPVLAAKWWTKAAEQGHPQALYQMGFLYSTGRAVKKRDIRIAAKCWERAADKGAPEAQYQTAVCHFHGHGTSFWERNLQLTAHYDSSAYAFYAYQQQPDQATTTTILETIRQHVATIQQTAGTKETDKGDKVDAQLALAFCYREGLVVPQDFVEAQRWTDVANQTMRELRQLADQKVASTSNNKYKPEAHVIALGIQIASAQIQMSMNMAREVLFRRKQQSNDRISRRRMSSYGSVDSGEGIQEDYIGVAMWLKRAAEQPHIQHTNLVRTAQYRLGDCYCRGWGVSVNYALAMGWLQKAVADNEGTTSSESYSAIAYYTLGQCHFNGRGRGTDRPDFTQATKYFHQAYMRFQAYHHPSTEFSMALAIERCISTIQDTADDKSKDPLQRADAQRAVLYCQENEFLVSSKSLGEISVQVSPANSKKLTSEQLCHLFGSILSFMGLASTTKQNALTG